MHHLPFTPGHTSLTRYIFSTEKAATQGVRTPDKSEFDASFSSNHRVKHYLNKHSPSPNNQALPNIRKEQQYKGMETQHHQAKQAMMLNTPMQANLTKVKPTKEEGSLSLDSCNARKESPVMLQTLQTTGCNNALMLGTLQTIMFLE